jgi:hypothetical protein
MNFSFKNVNFSFFSLIDFKIEKISSNFESLYEKVFGSEEAAYISF